VDGHGEVSGFSDVVAVELHGLRGVKADIHRFALKVFDRGVFRFSASDEPGEDSEPAESAAGRDGHDFEDAVVEFRAGEYLEATL
jgi:hypothetical protein